MSDYSDGDFWTEERCIQQRAACLNVVLHPQQFPRANADEVWREIEAIEAHMLVTFATVRIMRVLCGDAP